MAKHITQKTFDDVVWENINDFEMETQEAIDDAMRQFEAQGVNLGNIVKDVKTYSKCGSEEETKQPVIIAVENLAAFIDSDSPDLEEFSICCQTLKSECNVSLAHRCLAGSNNAYPILIRVYEKFRGTHDVLLQVVDLLCALCDGQPDVLDNRGIELFLDTLGEHSDDAALVARTVKLVRLTCVMHEMNRQSYVKSELIPSLISVLEQHRHDAQVVKEVCHALRILTLDDDIRVPFGNAHQHAVAIVTHANALQKILNICADYSDNLEVLAVLFQTLGQLSVRNEFCQEIMDHGGLQLILNAMANNMDNQELTKQILYVVKAVAGNDKVKVAIAKLGGLQQILLVMSRHLVDPAIIDMGCAAIGVVVLRQPEHCKIVMTSDGADVIVKGMQLHRTVLNVQMQACIAIRNLVARNQEYCTAFLAAGAEDCIRHTIKNKACGDVAKAALRDLGCKVELKELWKGEGKDLSR